MPLIFAIGLPIGLANKAQARACLSVLVSFMTWNYFINAMGMTWGDYFGVDFNQAVGGESGLAMVAGIKTLDTSIIGAIAISGIVTALHNRLFDRQLPVFLGIFQGSSFVTIVAFFVMIPCAWLTLLGWPKVQMGIASLQEFMLVSGPLGVWVYTFLERILIPTGLHHFIYGPFIFGPTAVEGGIQLYWAQHMLEFSQSTLPLIELFPRAASPCTATQDLRGHGDCARHLRHRRQREQGQGGRPADPGHPDRHAGGDHRAARVHLPLHLAPAVRHPCPAGGHHGDRDVPIRGRRQHGRGLLDQFLPQNWIPMFHNHAGMMFTQIAIGLTFTGIWFLIFRTLILKFNLKTPGRDESEIKLYSKADYQAAKNSVAMILPAIFWRRSVARKISTA